jgi:hypothetical protein
MKHVSLIMTTKLSGGQHNEDAISCHDKEAQKACSKCEVVLIVFVYKGIVHHG